MRRLLVLVLLLGGCDREDEGNPLRREGECAQWPPFVELPSSGVLDDARVFFPLGKPTVRTLSARVTPCSDPSNARLELTGAGAGRIVSLGSDRDGGVSASIEFETSSPGPLDVRLDFGDAFVQARWYAVEERPRLARDPSAVFVAGSSTVRLGSQALGQVPPRAFSVGSIIWSHAERLESWVVTSDGGISTRGVFPLDGTWSVSAVTESTVVAVRPGAATEIAFFDGGYQATSIAVDPGAQDPMAKVNGRWVRYRQGVLQNPNDLSAGFAGGRLCELDGGCSPGAHLFTELRPDGIVAIPTSLDRFVLLDGPSEPRASIEFPLGAAFPWLRPMTGVEGEGTALVTGGGVLVPEFTGTPRLLFYPLVGPNLFLPRLTRDWFIEQDVGYRR